MECYAADESQGYRVPGWEGGEGAIEGEKAGGVDPDVEAIVSLACDVRGGVPVILLLARRGYVRKISISRELGMSIGAKYFRKIGERLEKLGLAIYVDGQDPLIVVTEAGLPLIRRAAQRLEKELLEKGAETIADRSPWRSPRKILLDTKMAEAVIQKIER
ncbi:MAG: hypothetical protein QXE01_09515 [Sulfolobales archaeon]